MKKKQKQSSLLQDFMLLSAAIVVVLLLASLWVANETYNNHSERIISSLENEAIRIDRALIVEIKNNSYILESLGRRISQIGAIDRNKISRLLRSFDSSGEENGDVFSWINSSQEIEISSHRGILTKSIDISDRDYIKKALADPWNIQIGRPILGRVSGQWVLPICIGLSDYHGNHIGAIVASVDIKNLTKEIEREIKHADTSYAILSTTLTPLTEINNDKDDNTPPPLSLEVLSKIDLDKYTSGILSKASLFQQNNNYSVYETSSKLPYIIVIGQYNKLNFPAFVFMLLPRFIELLMIAAFLFFILWLVRSRIIKPVHSISLAASELIQGNNYNIDIPNSPVEIEELAEKIKVIDKYIKEKNTLANEMLLKNSMLLKIKESAQLMNKVRTKFLCAIAQELDKPVAFIQEASESIKDQHFGSIDNETYLKQANEIFNGGLELKQVIADIQAIADLEEETRLSVERHINVGFIIHKALRSFLEQPQHRHLDIKLRQDEALPLLLIDEERLNQILLNLFAGAAFQLSPTSSMVLECSIKDADDLEKRQYVFMLKYKLTISNEDSSLRQPIQDYSIRNKQADAPLLLHSEGVNLALTRMLVSLYDGVMETKISNNHVCRIYIQFPSSRIKNEKNNSEIIDSAKESES